MKFPEDKEFIQKFAEKTYRDQTSVLRFAINELRKQIKIDLIKAKKVKQIKYEQRKY